MNRFRLLAALCVFCGALFAAPSFADADEDSRLRNISIDAGATMSTSPASGWESATGLSFGLVYRLGNNAGIRVAVERYKFPGINPSLTYTRMPVFLGGRFYFWGFGDIWSHADLGMEMSIDQRQYISGGAVLTENQSNVGGAALYGILYEVTEHLFMGADVKWHLNKNSYWSYGIYLGIVF